MDCNRVAVHLGNVCVVILVGRLRRILAVGLLESRRQIERSIVRHLKYVNLKRFESNRTSQ